MSWGLQLRTLRPCWGNGLAIRLSVTIQLQSGLDVIGDPRLECGRCQVDGLLGGGDGVVEAASGGVGGGEGVEIGGRLIFGELTGALGQSYGLRGVAAVRWVERGE